jgi:hypothetical protein
MAKISDKDRDVFSNMERTYSELFTDSEIVEIHKMAIDLETKRQAVIERENIRN